MSPNDPYPTSLVAFLTYNGIGPPVGHHTCTRSRERANEGWNPPKSELPAYRYPVLLERLGGHRCITCGLEPNKAEITVLYDAFGKPSAMKKDWGFSALIEYRGKRILFDTGNNADIFAHNVKAKGIDLTTLDFVVISHRHGDHTSGLNHY